MYKHASTVQPLRAANKEQIKSQVRGAFLL